MNFLRALRYFHVVRVVPPLFLAGFVVAVAAAAARLSADASAAVDALTPVLLLHLFAASSGFQVPARRGYYDLLLTSGSRRWQIAAAHWVASIVPGITSWLCVGLLELAASHGTRFVFAAGGTCAAFLIVSLIAWAIATPMPRGTAAIGWLLVMTIPSVARFVSPVQLLGVHFDGLSTILMVVGLGLVPAGVAVACIARSSVPLEAGQ
jgi:hypothetical protein